MQYMNMDRTRRWRKIIREMDIPLEDCTVDQAVPTYSLLISSRMRWGNKRPNSASATLSNR